jgi:hypothetical protein
VKYDKSVFARIGGETSFKINRIKDRHNFSNREIIEFAVEKYEEENPVFANHVKLDWINHIKSISESKELETQYELESLLKDYYKSVLTLSKFEKSFDRYHINDLDDFIRAFYEIKKRIDEKGSFDDLDESFWIRNSQVFDISVHDLKEATKELLQVIE